MPTRILIFDTTLRDGEQSPGYSMNTREKLELARQLARLRVDVIEAGFPIASPDDFEAVRVVAQHIRDGITIAGLCRTRDQDIDRAWEALQHAERPRIHTFIATSDIHMQYKLKMSREAVLESAARAVTRARGYTDDVEFSCEDACRTDLDFLCRVVEAAIKAHPGVEDCVVAGRPSARWGDEVVAVVARRRGCDVGAAQLLEKASRRLARFKLPKTIVFVDEIVRSPSGKADYRWAKETALAATHKV